MHRISKLKLAEVNLYLVCKLCNGYFIDPCTAQECLHSCELWLGSGLLNQLLELIWYKNNTTRISLTSYPTSTHSGISMNFSHWIPLHWLFPAPRVLICRWFVYTALLHVFLIFSLQDMYSKASLLSLHMSYLWSGNPQNSTPRNDQVSHYWWWNICGEWSIVTK